MWAIGGPELTGAIADAHRQAVDDALRYLEDAAAQWTFRAAPQPLIRNVTVFANSPAAGSHTLIASTLTVSSDACQQS